MRRKDLVRTIANLHVVVWIAVVRVASCYVAIWSVANGVFPVQVIYTIQSTLAFFAVNHGQGLANNGLTGEQRALLDPGSVEFGLRYVSNVRRE